MIILDTNTMYRIAGIENDEKLDINKLQNFIKKINAVAQFIQFLRY